MRSPLSHRSTFDLLRTHLLCERPLTGDARADWRTVLAALRSGAAWLTCPCVAPAAGARLWGERPDGSVVAMGAEAPSGRCLLRARLHARRISPSFATARPGGAAPAALDLEIGARGVYRSKPDRRAPVAAINPVHLR